MAHDKCGWKRGEKRRTELTELAKEEKMERAVRPGLTPAIPSNLNFMHHGHPSSLPFSSLRSALTGPGP
jgi:hypothetical protein